MCIFILNLWPVSSPPFYLTPLHLPMSVNRQEHLKAIMDDYDIRSAASILASVKEQEARFERLTRALEEERRNVSLQLERANQPADRMSICNIGNGQPLATAWQQLVLQVTACSFYLLLQFTYCRILHSRKSGASCLSSAFRSISCLLVSQSWCVSLLSLVAQILKPWLRWCSCFLLARGILVKCVHPLNLCPCC